MKVGKNKGKKYVKLKGFEQATPQSEKAAQNFMGWYGDNFERIRDKLIFGHLYDDELATDTALMIYENIALKRFIVVDYQAYFLRAYHTNRIAKAKRRVYESPFIDSLGMTDKQSEDETEISPEYAALYQQLHGKADTPDFDYEQYELAVDQLNTEMLDYVRATYDPLSVSLFEIYVGLLPNTSYKRLSELLGIPVTKVWTSIGAIRKDLAERFAYRNAFMLSQV